MGADVQTFGEYDVVIRNGAIYTGRGSGASREQRQESLFR